MTEFVVWLESVPDYLKMLPTGVIVLLGFGVIVHELINMVQEMHRDS